MSAVKHRNIVEIHNFGQLPTGGAYLMMELIEGETLAEVIAREAPMAPVRALQLCEEILAALAAAHAVGVVHRDLKPGNIVLMRESSGDLVLKVLDFGLARQVDTGADCPPLPRDGARAERISLVAGTPEYICPEQASGKPVDGAGDLYAMGVILFEMLTGRLPFESESALDLLQAHRSAIPPLVSAFVTDVHPQLDAFVDQLLGKDPAKRAESAKAARLAVQKLEETILAMPPVVTPLLGPVVRQLRPPTPMPVVKAARRFRVPARAAGIALLVGAASVLALSITSSAASTTAQTPTQLPTVAAAPIIEPEPEAGVLAVEPEPEVIALVPLVAAESIVRPARRAPAKVKVHAKTVQARAAPKMICEVNATWRSRLQQQLEHLEQLSIAAIPDTANPSLVAGVKSRARTLASAVSAAQGSSCAQVEAQVFAWKASVE